MSYDVTVLLSEFNYTSNMRKLFIDFDVYPPDWNGLPRAAVAVKLIVGLEKLHAEDMNTLGEKYDADNGWGTVESAIAWLEGIRDACLAPLDERVYVSA